MCVDYFDEVQYDMSKAQGCKDFWKPSKACHVGIHLKALTETSQMSANVTGFQSFSVFLHHFVLAKLVTTSTRVKCLLHEYILIYSSPWV